jgi:hypothetical protein
MTGFKKAGTYALGLALVAWGVYAVVGAALGDRQGTDASAGFGYLIGIPLAVLGTCALVIAARTRKP